jgi:hypothetical protein
MDYDYVALMLDNIYTHQLLIKAGAIISRAYSNIQCNCKEFSCRYVSYIYLFYTTL